MSNKEISKLLYFFSMFDGGLYVTGKCKHARFIMNMLEEHLDYVNLVVNAFKSADIGINVSSRKDYNTDGFTRKPQVRVESKVHPKLTAIWERIYIDGKKVIDPHMLTMLDAESLAIIFMADGSRYLDKRCDATASYSLNTKGLSYGDNLLLKKALKDKLALEFNVHRHGKYWYLRLRTKDAERFESIVAPHITRSFLYKLGRLAPEMGDDIVCTSQECEESGGNDQT